VTRSATKWPRVSTSFRGQRWQAQSHSLVAVAQRELPGKPGGRRRHRGLPHATYPITMNGMTYHPQNVALLPWFEFQSPSTAIDGAYSYPDESTLPTLSPIQCPVVPPVDFLRHKGEVQCHFTLPSFTTCAAQAFLRSAESGRSPAPPAAMRIIKRFLHIQVVPIDHGAVRVSKFPADLSGLLGAIPSGSGASPASAGFSVSRHCASGGAPRPGALFASTQSESDCRSAAVE